MPYGRQGPRLGYKRLKSFQSKSPGEITNELLNCKDSFRDLLSSDMNDDWVYLLVCALAESCKSHMKEHVNEILSLVKESSFLSKALVEYILALPYDNDLDDEQFLTLIRSLIMFFNEWMNRLSTSSSIIPLDQLLGCLQNIKESGSEIDLSQYIAEVQNLLEIRDHELRRRREQNKQQYRRRGDVLPKRKQIERKPPNDFHDVPIEPTVGEITSVENAFLRRNKTQERYEDLNDYLDVQFRLLREDFVGPLREGIRELIANTSREDRKYDLFSYEDVHITNPVYTSSGMAHSIRFRPLSRSKEVWQHSKRLLFGSFLCLSKDTFKTIAFATVANRKAEDLAKGCMDIRFLGEEAIVPQINSSEKFVMVESPAYFESYSHVLRRLQEITPGAFPFEDYLVQCSPDVRAPVYLRDLPAQSPVYYDLKEALSISDKEASATIEVLNEEAWPSEENVCMNASQLEAVKAALTKEFVVIQGPPGTGKTYVGLRIVRALLDNRTVWDPDSKSCMLMVCYTNHALDQFLEGVLEFVPDGVVRVGGRSRSELLGNHNLHELVKSTDSQRRAYRETKEFEEELERCKEPINDSTKRILTLNELSDVVALIHKKQLNSRINEYNRRGLTPIEGWLGLSDLAPYTTEKEQDSSSNDHDHLSEDTIDVDYDADIIESQRHIGDEPFTFLHNSASERRKRKVGGQKKRRFAALDKEQLKILERTTKLKPMSQFQAFNVHDLWGLGRTQRWSLYLFWLGLFHISKQEQMAKIVEQHQRASIRLVEVKRDEELKILSKATVIGMTTTGAAKYSTLLEQIQPSIVIVEEAAEVLEAHIITSLTQGTQHLILIGDHKQLRPNPTCYKLSIDYNLDISLFERMVKGGMKCESLNVQHRMRPEISSLLKHIYSDLYDHQSVSEYHDVLGIDCNVYFINHGEPEDNNENNARLLKSYSNTHEAKYMVALCEYLLNQGYEPAKITLLTMYTGQLIALRNLMPKERFEESVVRGNARSHVHINTSVTGYVDRSKLKDIEKVKLKILREEQKLQEMREKLLDEIDGMARRFPEISSRPESMEMDGLFLEESSEVEGISDSVEVDVLEESSEKGISEENVSPCESITGWLDQRITLTELATIENQLRLLKGICELRKQTGKDLEFPSKTLSVEPDVKLIKQQEEASVEINAALSTLQESVVTFHISQQELTDVRDELSRVGLMLKLKSVQCKLTKSKATVNSLDRSDLERIEHYLTNGRRLSETEEKHLTVELNSIGNRYGVFSITHEERIMIVAAMNFTTGHWYKCPNGHIYAIGECGGANEEAKCPECKQKIGGKSHKLAEGNQVAGEMDGAKFPAWSEQNNMANFDPAELRRLQF
ncbi:hypothetical protein QZH41_016357, partial [Actinostola sp. cb2023]